MIAGSDIGVVGIAFAFGLALIGAAYGIGPISGCHINPAVSLAALIAGRMEMKDFAPYVIAQVAGGDRRRVRAAGRHAGQACGL